MEANRRSSIAGFEGKNFYFHLENSPLIAKQLTKYITELGGEIKSFLDQRIKYIVTNRPKDQWPPKVDTSANSRYSLPALEPLKDQIIQSPINLNKNSSFSRGKLLLSAIAKSQQSTSKPTLPTDVLERGRYWNITILKDADVLDFCRRHLSPVVTNNSTVNSAQIKRLKGPFIKVEDSRLQHRPVFKEFGEWPHINFEYHELLCPFLKKKVQKDTTNETTVETLEGLAIKNRLNDNPLKNKSKNAANNNNNYKTVIKSKQKSSQNNKLLVKKNLIKKRRTPAFCEICGTDYEDLMEHLKSETHESYTKNEENYKELKGVIQSLLPFNETNNSIKRIQFDAGSDSCDDSDNEQPNSPFQSTPNMSTIQLCGSKHKSHFLSIHDLIGNKSPQTVEGVPDIHNSDCDEAEGESSKTDLVFIPPSVTSPDQKIVHKLNQILNSGSNDSINNSDDSLHSKTEMNCISDEL